MSQPAHQPEPGASAAGPVPPPLPTWLRSQWPVVVTIALGWALATVASFAVPALEWWRPTCVAGLGVGVVGTAIFLWQRTASRRGARGAQVGFD